MEAIPDTSKDRGSPASGARLEAPVTGNTENTQTDAQGGLCGTAISKSENNHEVAILIQGHSAQKGGCRLEAHLGDSLVQNTSKQDLNSNESKKRISHPGIKEVHVSTATSSSRAPENSVEEIKDARSKLLKKSDNADPPCEDVKNGGLEGTSEEFEESENTSSSLKDENKNVKNTGKGKNNGICNTSASQDLSLRTGTGTPCLMMMFDQGDTESLKYMGLRDKQDQNEVILTKSLTVDNAKTIEDEIMHVDSSIEKKYDVVQPSSLEKKETENVPTLLVSCMLDSNKLASSNNRRKSVRGGADDNTNRVTTEEKVCQSVVGEGFIRPSVVLSRPYSSEDNHNLGSAKDMRDAIFRASYISPVIENVLPSEDQKNQLYSLNEGANCFQVGMPASNVGTGVHHSINIHELGAMRNSEYEVGRSYYDHTSTERNNLHEKELARLSADQNINSINPLSLAQAYNEKLRIAFSPRHSLIGYRKKKLLILDLNGLLADINEDYHNAHMADAKVRRKLVFRRPYCADFLNFCIQNFELGIWSSRKRKNVDSVVDILMRDLKTYLLFSWDRSKCTFTGRKTLENMHKPIVLKELRKLWNKEEPGLPWDEGDFSPSNTLLVDDSPYKALRNPPHTAIFPHPFTYLNWNDNSLGPGGDLRVYLQNLIFADDVECYVRNHPFGQPCITQSDPHWNFYAEIAGEGYGSITCCA